MFAVVRCSLIVVGSQMKGEVDRSIVCDSFLDSKGEFFFLLFLALRYEVVVLESLG